MIARRHAFRYWLNCLLLIAVSLGWVPVASAELALRGAATSAGITVNPIVGLTQTNNSNPSTSLTIAKPPTATVGGLLAAHVAVRGIGNVVTAPAGWTLINTTVSARGEVRQSIYYRLITSSEPASYTWNFSQSDRNGGAILQLQNVDLSNPINVAGSQTGDKGTITFPNLTKGTGNSVLFGMAVSGDGNTAHGDVAGMTSAYKITTGSGPNGISISGYTKLDDVAATTGIRTTSCDDKADNIGTMLVIRTLEKKLNLAVPTGTTTNDLMVASVAVTPSETIITPPAGWTLVRQTTQPSGDSMKLVTYLRKATAGEPASYTWIFTGATFTGAVGGMMSLIGVDNADPIDVETGAATNSGFTHTAPSVTTTRKTVLISSHAFTSVTGDWTPPSGMTEAIDGTSQARPDTGGVSLQMNYQPLCATGATGDRTATASATATDAGVGAAHLMALRADGATFNHLRIAHAGTGPTCVPTTLKLIACGDTECACRYGGGLSGTLTATGGPTLTWTGGTGFTIGETGEVEKTVQAATAGTLTWGATALTPAPLNATRCFVNQTETCSFNFTAAEASFDFKLSDHPADKPETLTVTAVKSDDSQACVPALTRDTVLNFACAYIDPASGTLPVTVEGVSINCGAGALGGTTGVMIKFSPDGIAEPTVRYADVGKIKLEGSYTGSGTAGVGMTITGSDLFITAPASFSMVPTGPYVAGNPFSLVVTAMTYEDEDQNKTPTKSSTPNFGKESTTENVSLTHTLVGPSNGNNPALAGTTTILDAAFVNGVATVSNIEWAEVGDISLIATLASGNYLGSGLTARGTQAVGPFKPAWLTTAFDTAQPCGTFTYSGQPFRVRVTAMNAAGVVTQNYTDSYAKTVTLGTDGATACVPATDDEGVAKYTLSAADFTAAHATTPGAASTAPVTNTAAPLPIVYTQTLAAPATVSICAKDADGVNSHGRTQAELKVRNGRLRLSNTFGAVSPVLMPIEAQYWTGTSWVKNTDDSCTTLTGIFSAAPTGWRWPASTPASSTSVAAGAGRLYLSGPPLGATTVTASDAPAWLKSKWNGSSGYDQPPEAKATIGIYTPEHKKTILILEGY